MKAGTYAIVGVAGLVAVFVVYRAMQKRRQSQPAKNAALDPNAWAAEYGTDASSQWVYDTYIRRMA